MASAGVVLSFITRKLRAASLNEVTPFTTTQAVDSDSGVETEEGSISSQEELSTPPDHARRACRPVTLSEEDSLEPDEHSSEEELATIMGEGRSQAPTTTAARRHSRGGAGRRLTFSPRSPPSLGKSKRKWSPHHFYSLPAPAGDGEEDEEIRGFMQPAQAQRSSLPGRVGAESVNSTGLEQCHSTGGTQHPSPPHLRTMPPSPYSRGQTDGAPSEGPRVLAPAPLNPSQFLSMLFDRHGSVVAPDPQEASPRKRHCFAVGPVCVEPSGAEEEEGSEGRGGKASPERCRVSRSTGRPCLDLEKMQQKSRFSRSIRVKCWSNPHRTSHTNRSAFHFQSIAGPLCSLTPVAGL